jgi:hypothetical protein
MLRISRKDLLNFSESLYLTVSVSSLLPKTICLAGSEHYVQEWGDSTLLSAKPCDKLSLSQRQNKFCGKDQSLTPSEWVIYYWQACRKSCGHGQHSEFFSFSSCCILILDRSATASSSLFPNTRAFYIQLKMGGTEKPIRHLDVLIVGGGPVGIQPPTPSHSCPANHSLTTPRSSNSLPTR